MRIQDGDTSGLFYDKTYGDFEINSFLNFGDNFDCRCLRLNFLSIYSSINSVIFGRIGGGIRAIFSFTTRIRCFNAAFHQTIWNWKKKLILGLARPNPAQNHLDGIWNFTTFLVKNFKISKKTRQMKTGIKLNKTKPLQIDKFTLCWNANLISRLFLTKIFSTKFSKKTRQLKTGLKLSRTKTLQIDDYFSVPDSISRKTRGLWFSWSLPGIVIYVTDLTSIS